MKPIISKIISLFFLVLTYTNVNAALATLTFDEPTTQEEVDGLVIQGVTFGYDGTGADFK